MYSRSRCIIRIQRLPSFYIYYIRWQFDFDGLIAKIPGEFLKYIFGWREPSSNTFWFASPIANILNNGRMLGMLISISNNINLSLE